MFDPVLSGVGFGILCSLIPGLVFFSLLQTALHEGFKAGAHLAFGVLLSDAAWITINYIFSSQVDLSKYKVIVGAIGGSLLIIFGVVNFFKHLKPRELNDERKTVHAHFTVKGFLLNFFNPAVPLFWLGVFSVVKLKEGYTNVHEAVFFGSVLSTVFCADLLKSFVSHRIKKILNPGFILWLNRSLGIMLVLIGIRMFVKILP